MWRGGGVAINSQSIKIGKLPGLADGWLAWDQSQSTVAEVENWQVSTMYCSCTVRKMCKNTIFCEIIAVLLGGGGTGVAAILYICKPKSYSFMSKIFISANN